MNPQHSQAYFGIPNVSPTASRFELIELGRRGLAKQIVATLAQQVQLTTGELLPILHLSERTWQRYEADRLLSQEATERAFRLAGLYQEGVAVFGSLEKFNNWMRYANPVFESRRPLDLLDSLFGFQAVEDELVRIDYGVLA